jgi:hypothetical protein
VIGNSKETKLGNPQRTVFGLFRETRALLKLLGVVLLVEAVVLTAGVAFLLILHGFVFALFLSARYWKPAYGLLAWALPLGIQVSEFAPIPMTWWRAPLFIVNMTVRLGMIGVGMWILFRAGFCGQNFICLLAK